jgi:hypothetical protein
MMHGQKSIKKERDSLALYGISTHITVSGEYKKSEEPERPMEQLTVDK